MRIHFKQSVLLIVCLICLPIGIYSWRWWQRYKLVINRFTYPTPKTNLNDLEQAILLNSKSISKCQHFAQGKQSFVVDSKVIADLEPPFPQNKLHSKMYSAVPICYLCERHHIEKTSGCCQTTSSSILGPHICDTCSIVTHCCSSFENCISCCLKPDHRAYLQHYIRSRDLKTKLLLSIYQQHLMFVYHDVEPTVTVLFMKTNILI